MRRYLVLALLSLILLTPLASAQSPGDILGAAQSLGQAIEDRFSANEAKIADLEARVAALEDEEPPPPPPPPPDPQCADSLDNDSDGDIDLADDGCADAADDDESDDPPPPPEGGTLLEYTDKQFRCAPAATINPANREVGGTIEELAVNGLPLRVILNYTDQLPTNRGGGEFFIGNGCVGDGDPATVEFDVDIRGDGLTHGPGDDAIRVGNGATARDLVITGKVNCGPQYPGPDGVYGTSDDAHQDGVQVLGGTNITFLNLLIGDYDAGRATCQGAGGAAFYSGDSVNVDFIGGKYIACNHGLLAGWASPGADVINASFRTGDLPDDAVCDRFVVSAPCDIRAAWGGATSGLVCQRYIDGSWVDE